MSKYHIKKVKHDFRLYITEIEGDGTEVSKICDFLLEEKTIKSKITIYINSFGGYLTELYTLIYFINTVFKKKDIVTILTGTAQSCGADILMLGHKRIGAVLSTFMVHPSDHKSNGNTIIDNVNRVSMYKYGQKVIAKELYSKVFTKKEIHQIDNGKNYNFDIIDMCKRNIVTHVTLFNGEVITRKKFLKLHK